MRVELVDYTGSGHPDPQRYAAAIIAITRSTRLEMDGTMVARAHELPDEYLKREVEEASKTIPSSWEFVDYTFLVQGVSRAFTHQAVRKRDASYAQQTMRTVDVSGWDYYWGESVKPRGTGDDASDIYHEGMEAVSGIYETLKAAGMPTEDARGILPTNIKTNIVIKMNLRSVADLIRKRSSARVQGEFRQVAGAMADWILEVHPWFHVFINPRADKVALALQERIVALDISASAKTEMIKALDVIRSEIG